MTDVLENLLHVRGRIDRALGHALGHRHRHRGTLWSEGFEIPLRGAGSLDHLTQPPDRVCLWLVDNQRRVFRVDVVQVEAVGR